MENRGRVVLSSAESGCETGIGIETGLGIEMEHPHGHIQEGKHDVRQSVFEVVHNLGDN